MGIRRKLNRKAIAHANAESSTHKRHVYERKQKREVAWIAVDANRSDASIFKLSVNNLELPNGYYYIGNTASESAVSGSEFEKELNAINSARVWHWAKMERHGHQSTVRRRLRGSAVSEMVINLSPFQMTFINREQARWERAGVPIEERKEWLLSLLTELRREVLSEFEKHSGVKTLGTYTHLDSNKVHFGVLFTRVDQDHQLLSKVGLHTIGPWSVAQSRIVGVGGGDPGDLRLKQNLGKFAERYGKEQVPMDLRLHMALDGKFDALVRDSGAGAPERYQTSKEDYLRWKREVRASLVGYSAEDFYKFGWLLIQLISPVLPAPLRAAISHTKSAVSALQTLLKFIDGLGAPSHPARREIQPYLSL